MILDAWVLGWTVKGMARNKGRGRYVEVREVEELLTAAHRRGFEQGLEQGYEKGVIDERAHLAPKTP